MQSKVSLSKGRLLQTLFWCILGLISLSVVYLYYVYNHEAATLVSAKASSLVPSRITIPIISVDTSVEHVGLTTSRAMGTPKNQRNVGWYSSGVMPGEVGSAVIDGHYGWKGGKASAFEHLSQVKVGDKVYIESVSGTVTSFVVRAIKVYDLHADTTAIFSSHDGKSHLNLITCDGVWDATTQNYVKRLVVFTDKE